MFTDQMHEEEEDAMLFGEDQPELYHDSEIMDNDEDGAPAVDLDKEV